MLVYQLEEMVAEKLRALLRRRRARDVYDLWQLTGKYRQRLDANLLYDTFAQKCDTRAFLSSAAMCSCPVICGKRHRDLGQLRCDDRCETCLLLSRFGPSWANHWQR